MYSVAMSVLFGGLITIVVTILVEYFRKPKLSLAIVPPFDIEYPDEPRRPARNVRFLRLQLTNRAPPQPLRWMSRNAALQCHGMISFHHLDDGADVFGRSMPLRWTGTPEPQPASIKIDDKQFFFLDSLRFSIDSRVDVYAGESQLLDVAASFDHEDECYGWNNETYFSQPTWRNPAWKLEKKRYLIKVTVISTGDKCEKIFRLINDVSQNDFRLEEAQPKDRVF